MSVWIGGGCLEGSRVVQTFGLEAVASSERVSFPLILQSVGSEQCAFQTSSSLFTETVNSNFIYDQELKLMNAIIKSDSNKTIEEMVEREFSLTFACPQGYHSICDVVCSSSKRLQCDGVDCTNRFYLMRKIQVQSLIDQLGITSKITWDFSDFSDSLDRIAEFFYADNSQWRDTPISRWLKSIKPSRDKYGAFLQPYSVLLKYIPKKGGLKILDFGCGSGDGANQLRVTFEPLGSVVYCYDVENFVRPIYRGRFCQIKELEPIFDYVVLNNVVHHVSNLEVLLDQVVSCLNKNGVLLLKDHFVTVQNVLLVCLLHICYEPTKFGFVREPLYFRKYTAVLWSLMQRGFRVQMYRVPKSDVGDLVLVCRRN
jgi:SAM-dependent methyltransferase